MWFVVVYFLSFLCLLGGMIYEVRVHNNGLIPRYLYPVAIVALIPAVNTLVLAGLLIAAMTERLK